MENNQVMNDEQLEEAVGGVTRLAAETVQPATKSDFIFSDMTKFLAALDMTPAEFDALTNEKKKQLLVQLGLNSTYDLTKYAFSTPHGLKEFQ